MNVLVAPDAVTTGAGKVTMTLSAATPLSKEPSMATIDIARAVALLLVVENVIDSRAGLVLCDVALPARVSVPPP